MSKHVAIFGGLALAILVSGCQPISAGAGVADIRYRILEAPQSVVDAVIPVDKRESMPGSPYFLTTVSPDDFALLLKELSDDRSLLVDQTQTITLWPRTASTWSYSRSDGQSFGSGGGAGFLGTRLRRGVREIRIEFEVIHTIGTPDHSYANILYEGQAPDAQALVFLRPYARTDGTEFVHVIAFETMNWR